MKIKFIEHFEKYKPGDVADIHSRVAIGLVAEQIAEELPGIRKAHLKTVLKALGEEE